MITFVLINLIAGFGIGFRFRKIQNNIKLTWWDHLVASLCLVWFFIVFYTSFMVISQ